MQYFSHETLRVPMVLPDNISVATGGQIIAKTNIKYSGGRYSLVCLLCCGVEGVGKPMGCYDRLHRSRAAQGRF